MFRPIQTLSTGEQSTRSPFRRWQPWLVLLFLVVSRLLLVAFADDLHTPQTIHRDQQPVLFPSEANWITPLSGDDGSRYLTEAINVWAHGTFSTDHGPNPAPTAHDLPLFPFVIAAFLPIAKDPLLAAKMTSFLNCILFGVAALGVYKLGRQLTGSGSTAILAMLLFGCFPESFPYSVFYMPESLFLAFFVWSLVEFVRWLRTERTLALTGAFLLWGCSVLAKPVSVFVGPAMALIAIAIVFRQRRDLIRRTSAIAATFCLGASVLIPWLVRNYVAFGMIGLSSMTGANLFYVNYLFMLEDMGVPNAQGVITAKAADVIARIAPEKDNPMVRSELLGAVAKKEISANWTHYLRTVALRHPALYTGTGTVVTLRIFDDNESGSALQRALADRPLWSEVPLRALILQVGSLLILGFGYLFAFIGLLRLALLRNWFALFTLLFILLYFAVLIGPVANTRYRVAMLPALSLAAATGLTGGLRHGSRSRAERAFTT